MAEIVNAGFCEPPPPFEWELPPQPATNEATEMAKAQKNSFLTNKEASVVNGE